MDTLKPYQKRIMTNLFTHLNVPPTDVNVIIHAEHLYKYIISEDYATTTKRDYLIILSLLLTKLNQKGAGAFIYKKAEEYNKMYIQKELCQELDDNELKNYVKYDDLLNKVNQLIKIYNENMNIKNIINLLILALYVLHPPLRNDYNDMKVLRNDMREDRKYNYILLDGERFYIIINKDKVMSTHGRIEVPVLNPVLKTILKIYFNDYAQNNQYLFQDKNGLPYTKRQIQYTINKYFKDQGKTLNIYNLRSAYISSFYKTNLDIQTRQLLAGQMRHSRQTAELIYCKFF